MNFRIVYISFLILAVGFLFLQAKLIDRSFMLPAFLKHDPLANNHNAAITVTVDCGGLTPNEAQLDKLKKDYDALWAHLNYLYQTNDVEKGKEHYTEEWFRLICNGNPKACTLPVTRTDLAHELHIIDWSTDGLVCAAIDSNVHMMYTYKTANKKDSVVYTSASFAITMLYQGDYWRIDALHILSELPATNGDADAGIPLQERRNKDTLAIKNSIINLKP
jgi:hypothetical protein